MNTIEWLKALIGFDTTSRNSNLKLINAVEDWFSAHQIKTKMTFNDDRQKANLLATIPGHDGESNGGLILSGHTDQVPVDHQVWETDPFIATIKDDRIYGRGTADMKGFLAVILAMVPTINKLNLPFPVHFAFSYDEEVGCRGVPRLIADLLSANITPSACIVGEPSELRPVIAHKGIQVFKCKVFGHPVHSSLVTHGANAVEHAAKIICSIRDFAERIKTKGPFDEAFDVPFSTLSTNKIEGGIALNIIPGQCEFFVECRHLPKEKIEDIIDQINGFIQKELNEMQKEVAGCNITIQNIANVPSFEANIALPLVDLVSQVSGKKPYKVAYATEAGLFQRAGIETIIWGPGSISNAHGANEFITLLQLKQCEEDLLKILKGF